MSFVAKVFVVFNLIVSAFFLYFAVTQWTANTKWQKMYETEKTRKLVEIATAQKIEKDLASQKVAAERDKFNTEEQLAKEKRAKEDQMEENLKLQAGVTKANNDRDLANDERQEEARENKRLSEQLVSLHKIITKQQMAVTVERNNAITYKNEKADLETALNGANVQLGATNRELKAAQIEVGNLAGKIEELIRRGVPVQQILQDSVSMPAIQAKVLAVRKDVGLVMISAGSQNKVLAGYQFIVSNGANYKAKVQVDKVYPDMSSAKIISGTENTKGLEIEANDDAATHQ